MAAKFLLDTNVFLEYLLDREKADDVGAILQMVADGEVSAYVTSFALHSLELLLISGGQVSRLKEFLEKLSLFRGLVLYQPTVSEEIEVVEAVEKWGLDFDDACQYFAAKRLSTILMSFDHHFDETDVKRMEPAEALVLIGDKK